MSTVAVIQARMGSTRLPGKVMKQLQNQTVLGHVIERMKSVASIDEVWIATTTLEMDDVIAEEANRHGVQVYRGSENDVLDRYYQTALEAHAQTIVRITSDCPLIDPEITDDLIQLFLNGDYAYASNTLERSFPRGLDAEVFQFEALEEAWRDAVEPYHREHVTPYIYQHPNKFRLASHSHDEDLSQFRLTLDTEEDWCLIEKIYEGCKKEGQTIVLSNVIELLKSNPALIQINAHVEQKKLGE